MICLLLFSEIDENFQNSSEIDDSPALFIVSDRNLNFLQGFNIEVYVKNFHLNFAFIKTLLFRIVY